MKTDQELIRKGVPLRIDGLVKGAKTAVEQGLSFDDYCEMISKVIISGQPLWHVKMYLQKLEIHTLFGGYVRSVVIRCWCLMRIGVCVSNVVLITCESWTT